MIYVAAVIVVVLFGLIGWSGYRRRRSMTDFEREVARRRRGRDE